MGSRIWLFTSIRIQNTFQIALSTVMLLLRMPRGSVENVELWDRMSKTNKLSKGFLGKNVEKQIPQKRYDCSLW